MDSRILVSIALSLLLYSLVSLACPRDSSEKYCPEHKGCVAAAQNCSDGEILSCVNETAPCVENGTRYCMHVFNYTCGNLSCGNSTHYCGARERCIKTNESCCTELEEACGEVLDYASLFRHSGPVDMICHTISNFSNYTMIKHKNLVDKKSCENGTFFCPLSFGCILNNMNCNSNQTFVENDSFDIFEEECRVFNMTFCPLVMNCIPEGKTCSYNNLFKWYENGNMTMSPYGIPCPENETFCLLTNTCRERCELDDVMGNKSCNGTPGTLLCPETLQCALNETGCNGTARELNWTNITDSFSSGWLVFCQHRKLITQSFWRKTLECRPLQRKCKDYQKHKNKSCDHLSGHELCEKLMEYMNDTKWYAEKLGNSSLTNMTIWLDDCNVTIDNETLEMCKPKNKSCDHLSGHELCEKLMEYMNDTKWYAEKLGNSSLTNMTIWLDDCNVTIDNETLEMCKPKNKSCELQELCPMIRNKTEKYYNHSAMNKTLSIGHCNVILNATVWEVCNLSMPCEVHKLCHLLRKEHDKDSIMNRTIRVDRCNITVNATVMQKCHLPMRKNKSCELHKLCDDLRKKLDHHWMTNGTISVERCNITLNATVLRVCNISMQRKNKSCNIKTLCHRLHKMDKKYKGFPIMNRTVSEDGCNVTVNASLLHMCNISCRFEELCHHLRNLTKNHTMFSLPRGPMKVKHCNITLNVSALNEKCNISLHERSRYEYKIFFNGFKISDSVKHGVARIAVREVGVSYRVGTWKYKKGVGAWTSLGVVSPGRALILESGSFLRFLTNDVTWHGLATLKYSPVKSGAAGSHIDVSSIPHDPRHTLALVQHPFRPVANLTRFEGAKYTVPEDEITAGFKIADRFILKLSHNISYNIPGDKLPYLNKKVIADYNKTVLFLESLRPAIAIISTGRRDQGKWQIGNRNLPQVKVNKPEVVTQSDYLRFVSARNIYGNWTMKFVPIVYSNSSVRISRAFLDVPDSVAYAFKGVMTLNKTLKPTKYFVEAVLEKMASTGTTYSLANFNGVVDSIPGSEKNKTGAKNIAAIVYERVTSSSLARRLPGLPRVLYSRGIIAILNNPSVFLFDVRVTRMNDQPTFTDSRIYLSNIAYNLTTSPNTGTLVKDLVTKPPSKDKTKPLVNDIDKDISGIAVVQALNSSIGSWYYQAPNSQIWLQLIVDNKKYSDPFVGQVESFLLAPEYRIRFQMHDNATLWTNFEALSLAKIVFLIWDGSDRRAVGRRNITRPSNNTAAYSKSSVEAIVRRFGCDGNTGSKGKIDRCGKCGGDGKSCLGCDGILNSGAIFDNCGNCTGGTTGRTFDFMKDCANECGRSNYNDSCGLCKKRGSSKNATDCMGQCYGKAKINNCGICTGGTSGKPENEGKDLCGVCHGINSTCMDCDNVPNGGKRLDYCGQCRLPSNPLFDNDCIKLKLNVPESGSSKGNIMVEVKGASLKKFATVECLLSNEITNATTSCPSASLTSSKGVRVIRLATPSTAAGNYKIKCKLNGESIFRAVEDTSFLVYNKSAMHLISVSPNETFVKSAVAAHVIGAGFVNTTDLACVTQAGDVLHASFNSATNVSCSIPATEGSTRLQLSLTFSRADRSFDAARSANFTIYAPAPRPISNRFLDNLLGIVIMFDSPSTPITRSKSCRPYFKAANLSSLGSRAKCGFRNPITFIVKVSGRPTILPGMLLHFKLGAIRQKYQKITKKPSSDYAEINLQPPTNPVMPKAVLNGNNFLGVCSALKLNGGQSSGDGGRRLRYHWFVEWNDQSDPRIDVNATADLAEINSYFTRTNGDYSQRHRLKAPRVVFELLYKFKMYVENYLGTTSENTTLIVQRSNKQVPLLSLGTERKTIKAALGTTLNGRVQLSRCLPRGFRSKVLFLWEVDNAVGINLGITNQPQLTFGPRILTAGKVHKVSCTVSMESDRTLSTTATITLHVQSSPLQALIKGGDILFVGEDESFTLDASPSFDPDATSDAGTYGWRCADATNDACYEPDPKNPSRQRRMVLPTTPKITIDVPSQLKPNSDYTFEITFRKAWRTSTASVKVRVKPGSPPKIIIRSPAFLKVNPSKSVVIDALVITKETVTATWTSVQETGYDYVDFSLSGVLLMPQTKRIVKYGGKRTIAPMDCGIAKNVLQYGTRYLLRGTLFYGNATSYNDIVIITYEPPTKGNLDVSPASGFVGNTTFTLSADEGWSSPDGFDLYYQFGYYVELNGVNREEVLESPTVSNNYEVFVLPPGKQANNYTVVVFVDVMDENGAKTRQEAHVTVHPVVFDVAAINEFTDFASSDFESGNIASGAAIGSAISEAVFSGGLTDANIILALNNLMIAIRGGILSAIERGGVQDDATKYISKRSLRGMTSSCKIVSCDIKRIAENVKNIERGSGQSSKNRRRRRAVEEVVVQGKTGDEVELVLQIFDNIIDASNYSSASTDAKADFLSTIAGHEKSLCKGLMTSGPAGLAKSKITVIRTVKDSFTSIQSDFLEASTSSDPQFITATVTFRLGQSLKTKYESWNCTVDNTCTGTCVASAQFKQDLLIEHDPSAKNLTRLSDVVSIRLYNPLTLNEISESGLSTPVALRFPIENATSYENYTKECRMWNDGAKEWQLSGCSGYETLNMSIIQCSCTKLGFISVFKGKKISPTEAPSKAPSKPELVVQVEFAFAADYNAIISGNITKLVFISHLQIFLSNFLNISKDRISNMVIRSGSIIVTFHLLPSNDSGEASVNSTLSLLERSILGNSINFTIPGVPNVIPVQPNSFSKTYDLTYPTTPVSTKPSDDDDDGLSTAQIVIIAVVCSLALLAILAGVLYYFFKVRPGNNSKISPRSSQLQLQEHHNNDVSIVNTGMNNNAVDIDEKAV